jgi:hypothetical protein
MARDLPGELRHAAVTAARLNLMIWSAAVYCPRVDPDSLIVSCAAPWLRSTYLDLVNSQTLNEVEERRKRARRERRCPMALIAPSPASNDGCKPPAKIGVEYEF